MPLRPRAQSAQKDKKSTAVKGQKERSSRERYLSSVSQSIYQQLAMELAQAGGGKAQENDPFNFVGWGFPVQEHDSTLPFFDDDTAEGFPTRQSASFPGDAQLLVEPPAFDHKKFSTDDEKFIQKVKDSIEKERARSAGQNKSFDDPDHFLGFCRKIMQIKGPAPQKKIKEVKNAHLDPKCWTGSEEVRTKVRQILIDNKCTDNSHPYLLLRLEQESDIKRLLEIGEEHASLNTKKKTRIILRKLKAILQAFPDDFKFRPLKKGCSEDCVYLAISSGLRAFPASETPYVGAHDDRDFEMQFPNGTNSSIEPNTQSTPTKQLAALSIDSPLAPSSPHSVSDAAGISVRKQLYAIGQAAKYCQVCVHLYLGKSQQAHFTDTDIKNTCVINFTAKGTIEKKVAVIFLYFDDSGSLQVCTRDRNNLSSALTSDNFFGLLDPFFWVSIKFDIFDNCQACMSMFPHYLLIRGTADEHVRTPMHKKAMECAILYHALRTKSSAFKFKIDEGNKVDEVFQVARWYAHHDKVPHSCRAVQCVKQFIKNPEDDATTAAMFDLVDMCTADVDLNGVTLGELEFKAYLDNSSQVSRHGCIHSLSNECVFQSGVFETFSDVIQGDNSDAFSWFSKILKQSQNISYKSSTQQTKSTSIYRPILSSKSKKHQKSVCLWKWILHNSDHSVKQRGHRVRHVYEACEVEKTANVGEKWRHLMFSYAISSLMWEGFNGNKEGPIGYYPQRESQMAEIFKPTDTNDRVYNSRWSEKDVKVESYVGHNIVAIAVGKRGDILRVAYNHNVLFTSTVDHAEERLIDSLFKDPAAFVQKSHVEILEPDQKVDVGKHMQHISVYTSLEPCQQCSGKFHVALVPEVIFCQRDWEIQLMQVEMYEQFRKTRSIPASQFKFPPYQELARCYYDFVGEVDTVPNMVFFQNNGKPVQAKKTMPYFLCTDDCQRICQNGHTVFQKLFSSLFIEDKELTDQSIQQVYSTLKELQLKFGLDKNSADDWGPPTASIENTADKERQKAKISYIMNFRPALDCKQRRILQDDLECKRKKWIDARHDQFCSLQFQFDHSLNFTEMLIDQYFSPIADLASIFLPRELDGSLKGQFKIVLFNREDADTLKKVLEQEYQEYQKSRMTIHDQDKQPNQHFFDKTCHDYLISLRLASVRRKAVMWLERIMPLQQREVFLPHDISCVQLVTGNLWLHFFKELHDVLPRYREDSNRKIQIETSRLNGFVLKFKSDYFARLFHEKWIKCVRLDVQVPDTDDFMFSLTAHKDVRDSTVIKDFEFLLATKVIGCDPNDIKQPKSPVDFASPKVIWARGTPWTICGGRKKWLNIENANGQSFERRLWTVQFPKGCMESSFDALERGRFLKLIRNEPFSKKYMQPYSKPIFDHMWFSVPSSERFFVSWSPPILPDNFFGPTVDETAPSNGKYLICIFDIRKHAASEGNVFREFLLDWISQSGQDDGQDTVLDAFERFIKTHKIQTLAQFKECVKPDGTLFDFKSKERIDLNKLQKAAQEAAASHVIAADAVVLLISRIKSYPNTFLNR